MRNGFLICIAMSATCAFIGAKDAVPQTTQPKVIATPETIVIADMEGVIDFKVLELKGRNGDAFKIVTANTEHSLININGPVGLEVKKSGFLVYLSITLKAGTYKDTIVFHYTSHNKDGELRVPVSITVAPETSQMTAASSGSDALTVGH
jgi:hypothetical protein